MDVRIEGDELIFGRDGMRVGFQRTLRIPDDGKRYPLPAGFGLFPLRRVEDYATRVPPSWRAHGGIFLPMYQREAMWLRFRGDRGTPRAVKVGVGKICAVTGLPWMDALREHPQDYLVTPPQPWLDGICVGVGEIRQFVAMPLGLGYTVEGQVTGEERHGGLQISVFEPHRRFRGRTWRPFTEPDGVDAYPGEIAPTSTAGFDFPQACLMRSPRSRSTRSPIMESASVGEMGLAAGGRMKQKLYPDPLGIDAWQSIPSGRVFVHLVNSEAWRDITGEAPPETPITAKSYRRAGLPWFELYDETAGTASPQPILAAVKSTATLDAEHSDRPLVDDEAIEPRPLRWLGWRSRKGRISGGIW
ncbi:MAG: hypothetical protein IPK00_09175 [Deltaproteobacteria bacterium]|nr:hypothetical protein [Deltaproteobacteria bacterium]